MKKFFHFALLCSSFFLFAFPSQAQSTYISSTNGLGFSTLYGEDSDSPGYLFSWQSGLAYQNNFSERFALRTEIRFTSIGSKSDIIFVDINGLPIGDQDVNDRLNYIQLLASARFEFKFIYLSAGAYMAALTSARRKAPAELTLIGGENIREEYADLDAGLTTGVGTLIPLSQRVRLELGLQTSIGVLDVYEGNVFTEASLSNIDFGLQIGLQILLK